MKYFSEEAMPCPWNSPSFQAKKISRTHEFTYDDRIPSRDEFLDP